MQNVHFAVRACKQPGFMQRRIGPTVQICGNSGLRIAMVPCLHQCSVYIKRKLRVCRAQKCNLCFGIKADFAVRPFKKTSFMQRRIGQTLHICGNSGLPFAMVPCLHQCNVYIKRKLRVCRAQKCNPCFGVKADFAVRAFKKTVSYSAV